jgi:ABC-type transport system involved in multi-copper enzyme maturation permease subunit
LLDGRFAPAYIGTWRAIYHHDSAYAGDFRLFVGPVFTRQAAIAPRRVWFFAARTLFVAALFGIVLTSWQLLVGSQRVENLGDLAWFGAAVTQILAPLQLAVAMPFSALLVASAVALEKDRKTLELLLMTNLSNAELVLGKLLAGMLTVVMVVVAALPLLMLVALLGGVSVGQILRIEIVTLASALVTGSLGSTIALWREKTFQALAMTALAIVLWLIAWEIVAAGALGHELLRVPIETWSVAMSPWRAIQAAAEPVFESDRTGSLWLGPVGLFGIAAIEAAVLLNAIAIARVRVWNPTREIQPASDDEPTATPSNVHRAPGKVRPVWNNPVLWREVRTRAYGKKVLIIRLAYWVVFAVCAGALLTTAGDFGWADSRGPSTATQSVTALLVVSLILLNAAAVTALTSERDGGALDLLLVTDLSPKEIVFGKLLGAFYTAKEMVLLPLLMFGYLLYGGTLSTEQFMFLFVGWVVMTTFAATLGLHAGITYANSRTAIATSLGTLLFLFLGVATCMRMMLAFSNSFQYQLTSFLGFMAGGGIGLFVALGWRNPSQAIFWASILAPFATFFVITSYLLDDYDRVFLVTVATYGFATAAMLVPAVSEFDVALGRTVLKEE